MQILVASTADNVALALPALSAGPSVVAITSIAQSEAASIAHAFGFRLASQDWQGFGPGKALFWKPSLNVSAVGREQLYERRGEELAGARGAFWLALRWQTETVGIVCARCGPNGENGGLTPGEIASMLERVPRPFVMAVEGDLGGESALPAMRDATAIAGYTRILVANARHGEHTGARIFGVSGLNNSHGGAVELDSVFASAARLYCSPGLRVPYATHLVAEPGPRSQLAGPKDIPVAACYEVALESASSASSRTHASVSVLNSS